MIHLALLFLIYLSFISLGLPDSLLGSAWPSMYAQLGVPPHFAGYISIVICGGTVVSSVLSAKLIGRFGTGIVTVVSVSMTAAALLGFSCASAFVVVCLCAIPLGLGGGSVDAALNNYVALHYKAKHMSWLHCFWGVGASVGPLIMASYLTRGESWTAGSRTIGVLQLCLAVLLFITLPLWRKGASQNGEGSHGRETVENAPQAPHLSPKLSELLRIAGVKQVVAAFFCYSAIEATTGLWGSSYLALARKTPPEIAARWIALYYTGITAGRFVSGFLTMKLSNRGMIRVGQGVIALGAALLLSPLERMGIEERFVILPAFFIIGLGCAPIFPSLLHETPENFGRRYSQAIIGLQMACAYIGAMVMPPLFGRIASSIQFGVFPYFIGGALVALVIMTEALNRKAGGSARRLGSANPSD
ncbi:MAG: MFS transporter [Treponema sp.]|jgi:fucose permease|nr:MFS transporter [Treponema sp.]